jgi:hypothetical protein
MSIGVEWTSNTTCFLLILKTLSPILIKQRKSSYYPRAHNSARPKTLWQQDRRAGDAIYSSPPPLPHILSVPTNYRCKIGLSPGEKCCIPAHQDSERPFWGIFILNDSLLYLFLCTRPLFESRLYLYTVNLPLCHAPVWLLTSTPDVQHKVQTHMTSASETLSLN